MSEIKRYTIISNEETDWDCFEMDGGHWCLYYDVAPIIQRNKELEAARSKAIEVMSANGAELGKLDARIIQLESELARLREQEPVGYWNGNTGIIPAADVGFLPNWTDYYPIALYAEPKPAQIPDELVEWSELNELKRLPVGTLLQDVHKQIGYEDARAFVKSQLDKMGG